MSHNSQLAQAVFRFFVAILVAGFLGFSALAVDLQENVSSSCAFCHTMRPQYYTWQASSHAAATDCLSCHRQPGIDGALQLTRDLGRMAFQQVRGTYVSPLRMLKPLEDGACLACHSYDRPTTPGGEFYIPHQPHTEMNVSCVSCHSAVAHGDIGRRGMTALIPERDWDTSVAKEQLARTRLEPLKESCMGCHYLRRVSNSCTVCHAESMIPPDHLADDFAVDHGDEAFADLGSCNFCHGMTGRRRLSIRQYPEVAQYAKANRFCFDCHARRPASHGTLPWREHGEAARGNEDSCLACHDNQANFDLPAPATTTCASCHPSTHREGWQVRHSLVPGVRIQDSCWMCHYRPGCQRCHWPE